MEIVAYRFLQSESFFQTHAIVRRNKRKINQVIIKLEKERTRIGSDQNNQRPIWRREMNHVNVSFFSDLSVNTMTRRCRFPTLPKSALTDLIASSMTARESFACYRDGDGNVIALDKTGFCATE